MFGDNFKHGKSSKETCVQLITISYKPPVSRNGNSLLDGSQKVPALLMLGQIQRDLISYSPIISFLETTQVNSQHSPVHDLS